MNRKKRESKQDLPVISPFGIDNETLKREKSVARVLRNSQWWKRQTSRGTCYYCHQAFKPSELTMDHVVPMVRGGRSTKGNVVPACKECNTKKRDQLLMEWEEYLESLNK
ncbi:MAG: HNH endonuclease [Nitrospira sp.]|nr:HNH endonuclease [Candidatus Manganitrophaceae bacterium]